MIRLPAKVLSSEKRGDQYCLTVEIELPNFRRSFNSLRFGDQIPFSGSYRDGKLELRYYQDPGLEIGQQFPLWLSEFRNKESRWTPSRQSIGNSLDSVSFPPLKLFAGPLRVRESLSWPLFSRRSRK
jgi:hypothetical protein